MVLIERLRAGSRPEEWDQEFHGECPAGHRTTFDVDELEDAWFEPQNLECAECDGPVVDLSPEEALAECPFCRECFTMELGIIGVGVHICLGGVETTAYRAVGGSNFLRNLVDDFYEIDDTSRLVRERRDDFWNIVTHFTTAANFVAILRDGCLEARPTGFYGAARRPKAIRRQAAAVCLTETPHQFGAHMELRGDEQSFGFAFEKQDLQPLGLGPALNLSRRLIDHQRTTARDSGLVFGWNPRLLPFINVIEPGVFDFVHEREWRCPADIDLRIYRPYLVLPVTKPDDLNEALGRPGLRQIAEWLFRYGKLTVRASPT